jgi:hypothetical protein
VGQFVARSAVPEHVAGHFRAAEELSQCEQDRRLAQVSLGIIPQRASRHRILPSEGFVMFDTALVIVELVSGVLSVTQPREIAMYTTDFTDLASIAVSTAAPPASSSAWR